MIARARADRTTYRLVPPCPKGFLRAVMLLAAVLAAGRTIGAPGIDAAPSIPPAASLGASVGEPGETGGEAARTSRPTTDPDRLGEARLFFTAEERGPDDDRADVDRAAADATGAASPGAGRVPAARSPAAPVSGRASRASPPVARFQALLRIDGHVRVVLGDRPCRGDALTGRLSCDSLPTGVRDLSIDPDGRRLRVTWLDGRRRTLAVGAALRP